MRIVIFSGTTEGKKLSCELADLGVPVLVCVATEYGKTDQGKHPGVQVQAGRLDVGDMARLLTPQILCIDATHPYATQVTANIRAAAKQAGAVYKRLLRQPSPLQEDCLAVRDTTEAVSLLQKTEGNILLTTGAKELSAFAPLGEQRLFARVLPLESSLEACKEAGIWAIGVDSDQSVVAPDTILTSAMKRVDNACYDEAKEILEGGFTQGIQTFTLADGGVDIAPTTDNIDPEVLKKVDEVKEKIISGEIEVPTDKESFDAKYGDVYQLDD